MNQPLAGFAPAPVSARMENHGNHMLKVAMQTGNDLLARVGSMVAYEGFVQYEPNPPAVRQIAKDWLTGEGAPLMKCSGDGLLYRGRVGSGITGAKARHLQDLLAPHARADSPFADEVPRVDAAGTFWVDPVVVVDLDTHGLGYDRLRQPSYAGLRIDLTPDDLGKDLP